MPSLPTDGDGKLIPFDGAAIALLDLRRRGVKSEHDHVRYQLSPEGSSCTRRFSCAWAERFNAAVYLAGASHLYTSSGDTLLSRLMPQADPDFPNWVCTKVEIMPWRFLENLDMEDVADPDDGDQIEAANPGYLAGTHVPVFERAELNATFEMIPWDLVDDEDAIVETQRYVTWPGYIGCEVTTEADYIGLPGSVIQYVTDDGTSRPKGVPVPYPVGFVEGRSKFKAIWRRLPFDAWGPSATLTQRVLGTAADRGMIGAVNKTTFRGYPPLTLQLLGVEQRLLPDPTGIGYSWDVAYAFANKPQPHGHLGLYFHDPLPTGAASGYYQCLRPAAGVTTKAPGSIAEADAMFRVLEFADLFVVGEV